MTVPLDDQNLSKDPDDCECKFDPESADSLDEKPWHYLRRCPICRRVFYSLHCPHQRPCRTCGYCNKEKPQASK